MRAVTVVPRARVEIPGTRPCPTNAVTTADVSKVPALGHRGGVLPLSFARSLRILPLVGVSNGSTTAVRTKPAFRNALYAGS